jgi:hypothetical protein
VTVLPWEDEPAPPPHVNALAQTLARITQAAWASGKPERTTLSKGLTITAFLRDDELLLALTREDGEPSLDEAEIVARDAGWPGRHVVRERGASGRIGLLLTRAERAPPPVDVIMGGHPCQAIRSLLRSDRKKTLTQEQWDSARGAPVPRAEIVAVLTSHTDPSYPPELAKQAREARTGYLQQLPMPELLDELDWFWRHWSGFPAEGFEYLRNVMAPSFG